MMYEEWMYGAVMPRDWIGPRYILLKGIVTIGPGWSSTERIGLRTLGGTTEVGIVAKRGMTVATIGTTVEGTKDGVDLEEVAIRSRTEVMTGAETMTGAEIAGRGLIRGITGRAISTGLGRILVQAVTPCIRASSSLTVTGFVNAREAGRTVDTMSVRSAAGTRRVTL